jgi:hypothetical protein
VNRAGDNARMIRTRTGLAVAASLALAGCAALTRLVEGPIGPCGFDVETLQFAGDAPAQARCLLRPVAQGGAVSPQPAALPDSLAALVGQPVGDLAPRLQRYLQAHAIRLALDRLRDALAR